jgi:hypothetical protein
MRDVDATLSECDWRDLDCSTCPMLGKCWPFYDRIIEYENKYALTPVMLTNIQKQWAILKAAITAVQDNRTNDKIEQYMKGKE